MIRSLFTASTGMAAQQLNIDVIANNIANVTTTGFKRSRAEFSDLLYQEYRRVGTQSSDTGTIVPAGVQRTAAELSSEEKNSLSHRAQALRALVAELEHSPSPLPLFRRERG